MNFTTIVTASDFKKRLYSQVCKHKLVSLSLDWYQATKNRYVNCQISSQKFLKVESFDDKFNLVMPKINRFINFSCDINLIFWLKIWRHEWKYSTNERLKIKFSTKNDTLRLFVSLVIQSPHDWAKKLQQILCQRQHFNFLCFRTA